MAELEKQPVVHDHEAFLVRARLRFGFQVAYDALEPAYQVASELIAPRGSALQLTLELVDDRHEIGVRSLRRPANGKRPRCPHVVDGDRGGHELAGGEDRGERGRHDVALERGGA